MKADDSDRYRSLLQKAEQIDHLCDDFERRWLAGDRPQIEAYLERVAEKDRPTLLRELLQVELDAQLAQGTRPDRDQYVQRFRECADLVDRVLIDEAQDSGGGSSRQAADSTDLIDAVEGFQIVKELSRGGQAVVYQAIQLSTKRKIALKVMLEGPFAGPASKRRFEREIELVGGLRHPGIVSIYDSGVSKGRYYYAMEYIRGKRLTENVRSRELHLKDTLRLLCRVCDAVDYAHQRGVIHRDLKPSNILVDDQGDPHVLDFGLAKTTGADGVSRSLVSRTGQVVGTPAYMSPEQAAGRPDEVDMRSDVYALGVILYELVTGKPPYDITGPLEDVLRAIQQTPPKRPSLSGTRVNGEVETIVLKALSKDKERRYDTAGALGRDIRRFLAGEPVEAKRDSMAYILRKAIARYRMPAAIAATFLMLIVTASVALSVLYYRAERARAISHRARDDAEEARNDAVATSEEYRRLLYLSDMAAARDAYSKRGGIQHAVTLLERHIPQPGRTNLRSFEWYWLDRLCRRSHQTAGLAVNDAAYVVRMSPDGRTLAVGGENEMLQLWDINSRTLLRNNSGNLDSYCRLVFSADGRWLAAGSDREQNDSVELWDVARWQLVHSFKNQTGGLVIAAFSADDNSLVTVNREGDLATWDIKTRERVQSVRLEDPNPLKDQLRHAWHHAVLSPQCGIFAFGTSGTTAISGRNAARGLQGAVLIWDVETGRRHNPPLIHGAPVSALELSPDGKRLVSASLGIRVWDVTTGKHERSMATEYYFAEPHEREITEIAFSEDGNLLATTSNDATVKVWDFATGDLLDTFRGNDMVNCATFLDNGKRLATGAAAGEVRLWDIDEVRNPRRPKAEHVVRIHNDYVGEIAFSPTQNVVASGSRDGTVKLWDAITGEVCHEFSGRAGRGLDFSPDGSIVAWTAQGG